MKMEIKKTVSFMAILGLVMSLAGYGHAAKITPRVNEIIDEQAENFIESPAVTQSDIDDHYQHYASEKATYDFQEISQYEQEETVNHVGTVMDLLTDAPIPAAEITFNGEKTIVTDESGRFQISHLPAGKYDCVIHAAGYQDSYYLNMKIDNVGSTIISFFYMSKETEFVEDHEAKESQEMLIRTEEETDDKLTW